MWLFLPFFLFFLPSFTVASFGSFDSISCFISVFVSSFDISFVSDSFLGSPSFSLGISVISDSFLISSVLAVSIGSGSFLISLVSSSTLSPVSCVWIFVDSSLFSLFFLCLFLPFLCFLTSSFPSLFSSVIFGSSFISSFIICSSILTSERGISLFSCVVSIFSLFSSSILGWTFLSSLSTGSSGFLLSSFISSIFSIISCFISFISSGIIVIGTSFFPGLNISGFGSVGATLFSWTNSWISKLGILTLFKSILSSSFFLFLSFSSSIGISSILISFISKFSSFILSLGSSSPIISPGFISLFSSIGFSSNFP